MCVATWDVRFGPIADIQTFIDHLVGPRERKCQIQTLGVVPRDPAQQMHDACGAFCRSGAAVIRGG